MALMLRTLGIPARVAVGFTAGTWKAGVWTCTDQQAHAWVEAWFAGYWWLPSTDPGPRDAVGRVHLASDSADAVRALGTGRSSTSAAAADAGPRRGQVAAVRPDAAHVPWWLVAVLWLRPRSSGDRRRSVPAAPEAAGRDARRLAAGVRAELVDALVDRGVTLEQTQRRRSSGRRGARPPLPVRSLTDAIAEARYGPEPRARVGGAGARRAAPDPLGCRRARDASPSRSGDALAPLVQAEGAR
jgi:hypothetical protein